MTSVDVVIIGAGAAGGSAAFHLSIKGHKVIVVEKKADFHIKPCGGGMAASVQKWFPFSLKPVVDEIIQKVEFSWCLADKVVAELPGSSPFWIVRRKKLDELLINQSLQRGAQIWNLFEPKDICRKSQNWCIKADRKSTIYTSSQTGALPI